MAEAIAARLQILEDHAAIGQLIARYGPLADTGNAKAIAELWAENGIYCVGGFGEAQGREQIAALIASPTHRELMRAGCAHILSQPVVKLDGDIAAATNYSVVFRNAGGSFEPWRVSANRWAFVRICEGWLVSRRDNHLLNGEAAARTLLEL